MRWCARTSTPRRSTKRATGTTTATSTSPTAAPSSAARSAGRWRSAAARLLGGRLLGGRLLRRRLLGGRPFRDGLLGGGLSCRRLRDRGLLGDSLVRSRLFRRWLGGRRPRRRRPSRKLHGLRVPDLHLRQRGAHVAGAPLPLLALHDLQVGAQELDRQPRVAEVTQLAGLVREPHLLVAEAHQADHHLVGEVEGVQAPQLLANGAGALLVGRRAGPALLVAHACSSCISAVSCRDIACARRTVPANTSGKVSPST